MSIQCLQPAYMSPCSCAASWVTLSESWLSLRCFGRNVCICTMASSEVCAFVLELVLWLRCDGKEKAVDWQRLLQPVGSKCFPVYPHQLWWKTHLACLQENHTRKGPLHFQLIVSKYICLSCKCQVYHFRECLYQIINGNIDHSGWHVTDPGL